MIEATLNNWAVSLGMDDRTLAKQLGAAGVRLKPRKMISARDVLRTATGDLRAARTRRENAEADCAEVKARFAKNDAVKMDDAKDYVRAYFAPIREAIMEMPIQQGALCNPSDPEHAIAALEEWVREFFQRVNKPFAEIVSGKKSEPTKAKQ